MAMACSKIGEQENGTLQESEAFLEGDSKPEPAQSRELSEACGEKPSQSYNLTVVRRVAVASLVGSVLVAIGVQCLTAAGGLRGADVKLSQRLSQENFKADKQLKNAHTGLCLSWGSIIIENSPCVAGNMKQLWGYNDQAHRLLSRDFRCMDTGGKYLHVWQCEPQQTCQKWEVNSQTQQITQVMQAGTMCLTANKTSVTMQPCNANDSMQRWVLQSLHRHAQENGGAALFHMVIDKMHPAGL